MWSRRARLSLAVTALLCTGALPAHADNVARFAASRVKVVLPARLKQDTRYSKLIGVLGGMHAGERTRPIRRVFYPLGGADIRTPLALFRGTRGIPDEVVITDQMPFGSPTAIRRELRQPLAPSVRARGGDGSQPFIRTDHVVSLNNIYGPMILEELAQMGAHQVRVEYLGPTGEVRAPPARAQGSRARAGEGGFSGVPTDPAERDFVRISFNARGQHGRLLYVQQDMTQHPASYAPVLTAALATGIDAYLEKAAFVNQHAYSLITNSPLFRDHVLSLLRKDGGLIAIDPVQQRGNLAQPAAFGAKAELFRAKSHELSPVPGMKQWRERIQEVIPGGKSGYGLPVDIYVSSPTKALPLLRSRAMNRPRIPILAPDLTGALAPDLTGALAPDRG